MTANKVFSDNNLEKSVIEDSNDVYSFIQAYFSII